MADTDVPATWEGKRVLSVVDEWRVVDRWWTDSPIDRTYIEVELEDLDRIYLYREGEEGQWQRQSQSSAPSSATP